jgi:type II secretory pathway pseudopilin PulG
MTHNETAGARISARIARRIAGQSERGVAMLFAIVFMIIMAGLAAVILSTILGQVAPTSLEQKSTQTVYAAQAGMQAALSRFRAAVLVNGSGVVQTDTLGNPLGDPTKLPCSVAGTLDPTTPADGIGYRVTIWYYSTDPTFQSASWQANTANQIACSTTSGVPSTAINPVKYALLTSVGTGNNLPNTPANSTAGNRSVAAVYEFKVSTVNITGGYIYDYNDNGNYCLSDLPATGGSPAPGDTIQFLPASQCTAAKSALQLWSYGGDPANPYEIKLASSTYNGATGLCITGPNSSTANSTQNAVLQNCVVSGTARWSQLWSWYGSNTWQGTNPTLTSASTWNLGFTSASPLTGQLLKVIYNGTSNGFSPSTSVGAGAANHANEEIVNYLEFGRCMDVDGQPIPASNANDLISYPCKQDPTNDGTGTGKAITWNQKFYYTEPAAGVETQGPQAIIVNDDTSARYIPTNPSTLSTSTQFCEVPVGFPALPTSGTLTVVKACTSTTSYKIWTRVYVATTAHGGYGGSYLFTTPGAGGTTLCLQADKSKLSNGWSEIDVAPCVANSLAQKWNAPPDYTTSELGGYKEIGG